MFFINIKGRRVGINATYEKENIKINLLCIIFMILVYIGNMFKA